MLTCLITMSLCISGCNSRQPEVTRIELSISEPVAAVEVGTTQLGLGERLFINRGFAWRDGLLHVPLVYSKDRPAPLLIWLHGGGGKARDARGLFPIADQYGVVVLALDSRHNTWDGIDSPFGPDVVYIQRAVQHVVDRIAIDPRRLALGGVSDGGSYALALGRSNGDIFPRLVAVSPWRLAPPSPPVGKPRIFIAHGREDTVYPEWHSRRFLAPGLAEEGYDVTYFAYDGPHWVTDVAGHEIMRWLVDAANN